MNLIIDIGNTQTKYALFKKEAMLDFFVSQTPYVSLLEDWQKKYSDIDAVIIASVQNRPTHFMDKLRSKFGKLIFFDHRIRTPLNNLYKSKETLGYDRLAACIGANLICPDTNLLVIDAGTAITFDFVSCKNEYLGGTISPGLGMRFRALNSFTKKLPLQTQSNSFNLIGENTEQAITFGVQNGFLFEIEAYINQLKKKHSDTKVFLTGGDSEFIYSKLKNKVFCDKFLLMRGLNTVLNYNNSEY